MKIMFVINDFEMVEPFGVMILSATVKEHETVLGVLKKEDVQTKIDRFKPDILAYSAMTMDMPDIIRFNNEIGFGGFTVLGGAHTTITSEMPFGFDAICVGEGDRAFPELVEMVDSGGYVDNIQNIQVKGGPLKLANKIVDLDAIPFMDRDLVDVYPEMHNLGLKGIWTSRGCVHPCPYCYNHRINEKFKGLGSVIRRRSVDSVIREAKLLKENYRCEFIRVQDDVFVHRVSPWFMEFAYRWPREIGLPLYVLARLEYVTEELVKLYKQAGVYSVAVSIEAADDNVRNVILKRNMSKGQMKYAFSLFKRYGINVYCNSMFGLPHTTLQQDIDTLDFNIKVQPDMPDFSIFAPYDGLDLSDKCRDEGIVMGGDLDYGSKNRSVLTCFHPEDKNAQVNLCQLGIVAVKIPILRDWIVNDLIHRDPSRLSLIVSFLFYSIFYPIKVFWYRYSFREFCSLIGKTIRYFLYDHSKKRKPMKIAYGVRSILHW